MAVHPATRVDGVGIVHQLIRALEADGEPAPRHANVRRSVTKAEAARELAYRLIYMIAERRKRTV